MEREVTCKLCGAEEYCEQPLRNVKVFQCGTEWHACSGGWRDGAQSLNCRVRQLERDQADWRNGVDLIATAVGSTGPGRLSCAGIAEDVLKLRATLETVWGRALDAVDAYRREQGMCPVLLRERMKKLMDEVDPEPEISAGEISELMDQAARGGP